MSRSTTFTLVVRSRFTGKRIRIALTFKSGNRKTRNVVALWILCCEDPRDAARLGHTRSICNRCPWQFCNGGGCYVHVWEAPLSIWRARHHARPWNWEQIRMAMARRKVKVLRLGAYGDPAAVPVKVLRRLVTMARGEGFRVLGYTHSPQESPHLRGVCMASCENAGTAIEWLRKGWRTFRTLTAAAPEPWPGSEIVCPSANGAHCDTCGLCQGANIGAPSIVIRPHGAGTRKIWNSQEA